MVCPLNLPKELRGLGGDRGCKHPAFCYPKSLFLSAKYYAKGCNVFPFPATLRIPFPTSLSRAQHGDHKRQSKNKAYKGINAPSSLQNYLAAIFTLSKKFQTEKEGRNVGC